jgi:hypothetical protein
MSAPFRIEEVAARIEAEVAELTGQLGEAADFADLVERKKLPAKTGGFVLPGGLRGGAADAASGLFRQSFDEIVKVVLVVRVAGDPLRAKAVASLVPLARATINAVAGWAPDDAIGVFRLVQAELIGASGGALIFEIDFALDDQLRITTT